MGTIQHEAVIVTSEFRGETGPGNPATLDEAWEKAKTMLAPHVSEIREATSNGSATFTVIPCGSKLGWDEADSHDESINAFVAWLDEQRYGDRSSPLDWIAISYGELGAEIVKWTRSEPSTLPKSGDEDCAEDCTVHRTCREDS